VQHNAALQYYPRIVDIKQKEDELLIYISTVFIKVITE
jgi:hypothetical protein